MFSAQDSSMSFFQRVKNGVRRAVDRGMGIARLFSAHRITTIAGALAFFLVLSVVPLFFWLTLLFGREGLPEEPAFELFAWAEELISYLVKHAGEAASGAGVVLLLTTLWSASSFFYHLRRSGELLSGVSRPHGGLRAPRRHRRAFYTLGEPHPPASAAILRHVEGISPV